MINIPLLTQSERRPLFLLTGIFVISRMFYFFQGVRFNADPLRLFWQYLDPALLREHLLESLLYLHSQPPLFNLFLGIWLKLFGNQAYYGFWCTYLLLSLTGYLIMYRLLRLFALPTALSIGLATFYMVSPTVISYENWLFYTWPEAVLLLLSAIALQKYLNHPTFGYASVFFIIVAALGLIRSLFHLVWVVAVMTGLLLVRPALWKRTLSGAVLPCLLLLAVYTKNYVIFSSFSNSTWIWLNLAKMTVEALPETERTALLASRKLSPASYRDAFDSPEEYVEVISAPPAFGIEALDQTHKSTGAVNLNHRIYLTVSQLRKQDDLYVIKMHPELYGKSILDALLIFTEPATYFVDRTVLKINNLEKVYNLLLYGQDSWLTSNTPINQVAVNKVYLEDVGFLVVLSLLIVIGSGIFLIGRCLKSKTVSTIEIVLLYMWLAVTYVTVIGNAFEVGENGRFRVSIEPLLLISTSVWLAYVFQWFKKRVPVR